MSPHETGWTALKTYLKDDLTTAFSSALITIPLMLGIAIAAGVPPMAGILSAIVGGLVATFFRGSHVSLNGTAPGLIVVTLLGIQTLGDGDLMLGFRSVLAATIMAGGLLVLMGLLRFGRFGELLPPAVIHGVLIAIGLVIISKQIHVALGVELQVNSAFEGLRAIPASFQQLNPFITIIALTGILVLVFHPRLVAYKWIQAVPAPLWALLLGVPFVYGFYFFEPHTLSFFGAEFPVGPNQILLLPTNIEQSILLPDFSQIQNFHFWTIVAEISFIVYIETVISAKVVDKIDPFGRYTDVDRDLIAVGLSNISVGWVGGMPIITGIPLVNGAKTRWFNFYHGLMILIFALLLSPLLRFIPMAGLAALLVFTGYKLSSFKMFRDAFRRGDDQFIIAVATLVVILFNGILIGVLGGVITTFVIHYAKSNLSFDQFVRATFRPTFTIKRDERDLECHIRARGILNFISILKLKNILRRVSNEKYIVLDLSHTRIIDYTVMEYLHERAERYDIPQSKFDIVGLDTHDVASRHPHAMHILPEDKKPQLSKRQQELSNIAKQYDGQFWPEIRWDVSQFKPFRFFQTRSIEYKLNTAKGTYWMFFEWETCDLTFEEGALFANQERHTTVSLLYPPFNPPAFVLEREDSPNRVQVGVKEDINFKQFGEFSTKFLLYGADEAAIQNFFNAELIEYLDKNDSYHIECDGSVILIFSQMRFASASDMLRFHTFSEGLAKILLAIFRNQALAIA